MLTRRRFLAAGGTAVVGAVAVGAGLDRALSAAGSSVPQVDLGTQPPGLPVRQHAWLATLPRDAGGDAINPRHDRLLFFDVEGRPDAARARVLESSLRTLERTYPWGPSGLLFTAGWGPSYFERLGVSSPIPDAKALSDFELPAIDDYDLCLHLACDDEERLAAVEGALAHGRSLPGADGHLSLDGALSWRETRTGFVGVGLPAAHQDTGGIPPGRPVAPSAPLFMGFKSGLRKNQATEDAVTIAAGAFAGGTTMHVSYMRLRLDSWYQLLDDRQRVARMYAPQVTPAEARAFTVDGSSDPQLLNQAINRYGVIGHAQTSAQARRHGKPLIIRRDFDTVDGGQAGLHFVALQRTIADFVTTRNAMNASSAQLQNPNITDTVNNGINEFIFVARRANYILPPRARRSFPLVAEPV
ncbi:MAG: Tat pathway signal protein [Solirubrobacteraceae bacterium]